MLKDFTKDEDKTKMPWKQRVFWGGMAGMVCGAGFGMMCKEATGNTSDDYIYYGAVLLAVILAFAGFLLNKTSKPIDLP